MVAILISLISFVFLFKFSKLRTCNAALLHSGILLLLTITTNIYVTINASKNKNNWIMLKSPESAQEVTLLMSYYSIFFVISYIILRRTFHHMNRRKNSCIQKATVINPTAVFLSFLIIYCASFFFYRISPWAATYFSLIVDFATVSLIIIILLKFQFPIILIFLSLYIVSVFCMQLFLDGNVNRGGVFQLCIMIIFMASSIRKINFFTKGNLLILLLFTPLLMASVQVFEALYTGSTLKKNDLLNYLLRGYELRPVENFIDIFMMLKEGEIAYWAGKSVYIALNEIFYPFSNEYLSATNWYQLLVNSRVGNPESASGYGFSVIADSYLNFGKTGILFAAISIAILLCLIEESYVAASYFVKLLGAKLFILSYYVLRADLVYVTKTIWLNSLAILIYFVVYQMIRMLIRTNKRFKNQIY